MNYNKSNGSGKVLRSDSKRLKLQRKEKLPKIFFNKNFRHTYDHKGTSCIKKVYYVEDGTTVSEPIKQVVRCPLVKYVSKGYITKNTVLKTASDKYVVVTYKDLTKVVGKKIDNFK